MAEPRSLLDDLRSTEHAAALLALAELIGATKSAGVVLPSLEVELPARGRTDFLIQLGGVPPETAARLAVVILAGAAALAAKKPAGTVTHLWAPAVGDLVVDTMVDRVGEFRGLDDSGAWLLAPPAGGSPWPADPSGVRVAGPNDRIRAESAQANARSHKAVGG
ncbi:hypothetical protein [Kitasatospora sp. NPDC001527]|uniref:hypothetical protein n=1 Tax=Kitasatospora sp. NPDC001527 TaxID=3154519 RepID=UPI0033315F70